MRRLSRLDKSIDLLRSRSIVSSSLPFVCSACIRQAPFSTSIRQTAKPGSIPYTEKIRRKIWGSDEPPGAEDPYGGPSIAEQRRAARGETEEAVAKDVEQPKAVAEADLDENYEPATTWDGLVEVGEVPEAEYDFEGFMPAEMVTDPREATAALRRTVVEVFTMRQAGWPLSELSNAGRGLDKTSTVQISVPPSASSEAILQFSEGASEDTILHALSSPNPNPTESEEDVAADRSSEDPLTGAPTKEPTANHQNPDPTQSEQDVAADRSSEDPLTGTPMKEPTANPQNLDPTQSEQDVVADRSIEDPLTESSTDVPPAQKSQAASRDKAWLNLSLADPQTKFAIVKRVMQLTGIRIPDSTVMSVNTVGSLRGHLVSPPKPKRLAEALSQRGILETLPNVKIFERRVTPIDQEVSVGRWKVIEKELLRRNLPITGH